MSPIVTIFGGSGFVGRNLVRRLATQGMTIRIAVRYPEQANYLKTAGNVGQIVPIETNITHPKQVQQAIAGADYVVNLVGILFQKGKERFEPLQAEGPKLIGRVSAEEGVQRLIHVSAIGADPKSDIAYAKTKGLGEKNLLKTFPEATILRPSVMFGPDDDFINRFARMAQFSPFMPLIGGGKTRLQPVYVGDVAQAIANAIFDDKAKGQIYELGGPSIYTMANIIEYILTLTGRKRVLLPIPFGIAEMMGRVLQLLPKPLLTRDQVRLLRHDNIVSKGAKTLYDLGVTPTPFEAIIPTYLAAYSLRSRFAQLAFA